MKMESSGFRSCGVSWAHLLSVPVFQRGGSFAEAPILRATRFLTPSSRGWVYAVCETTKKRRVKSSKRAIAAIPVPWTIEDSFESKQDACMPARDRYHYHVKNALIKDGWMDDHQRSAPRQVG